MLSSSPSMRVVARRLLAVEAAGRPMSDADVHDAVRVVEKLRISLSKFVGADGFTALLRRALALAVADVPSLQTVKIKADGRLEGLTELAVDEGKGVEAATAITAHLLELLVTLIGKPLTLRLLREAWPDTSGRTTADFEDS